MNKTKETLGSVYKAARYSIGFCLRNNKKETIVTAILLLLQTLNGYGMIMLMGTLVSAVQSHLSVQRPVALTVREFVEGPYFKPALFFVVLLFLEIVLQKFKSFVRNRQRHILRVANTAEMNAYKQTLDIGRCRSKSFDDLEKKIDELPEGWDTRISFADEMIDFVGIFISFLIFGFSLAWEHPNYVLILVVASIPMIFAEFIAESRGWKHALGLISYHKRRNVLQYVFHCHTAFLQGIMFNQMPVLMKLIGENQNFILSERDRVRWQNLQITLGAYIVAMAGLSVVLMHSVYHTLAIVGDIGVLTVIIASARRFQGSIRDIVLQVANQWQSVKGTIMIEEEYFGTKPLLDTSHAILPEFVGAPRIRFTNVCFKYPDTDALVLKNISFNIEPGSKNVIVGKNGSGKSSLIGLLLRHYDPTSGDIRVGDVNLKHIASDTWSHYICALLQEFVVLERRVGEEIASSRLDEAVDMERVREAAKFAGFDTVIEKDVRGYEVQIGTEFGGHKFSGGQEQRLALARARYRKTQILILDEPDAKLDPEAANKLMDNVFALKGVTVIIVTQHISRAKRADNIILLHDGEVAEMGTHAELMARKGKYTSMLTNDRERLGT